MSKKLFTILLFLSTVTFANTPTHRHRVRMTEPDPIACQATIQRSLQSILSPSNPSSMNAIAAATANFAATIAHDLIHTAKRLIGSRYCPGSSGPSAFDCSGFTSYVFDKMGIKLKRSSREQSTQGEVISCVRELLPGDLVFFGRGGRKRQTVNHVGIVTSVDTEAGTFEFIHSSTSQGVRIDKYPDTDYWEQQYISGRRIIGTETTPFSE